MKVLLITNTPNSKDAKRLGELTELIICNLITEIKYYDWIILDLDNIPRSVITDNINTKESLAILSKETKVISKDFNRLIFYKDIASIYFGGDNFFELNFL